MPTLKQLTCRLEWMGSGILLQEYVTTYSDGFVETYVAIPLISNPFSIRLTSQGYIAPGLAMFVYVDGVYQCNRNQQGLKIPAPGTPVRESEINFCVNQKETKLAHGGWVAKKWGLEKQVLEAADNASANSSVCGNVNHVGTIEVVVLRCHAEPMSKATTAAGLGRRKTSIRIASSPSIHKAVGMGSKTLPPQSIARSVPKPTVESVRSESPGFGGLAGLFDGSADEPPRSRSVRFGVDGGADDAARSVRSGSMRWVEHSPTRGAASRSPLRWQTDFGPGPQSSGSHRSRRASSSRQPAPPPPASPAVIIQVGTGTYKPSTDRVRDEGIFGGAASQDPMQPVYGPWARERLRDSRDHQSEHGQRHSRDENERHGEKQEWHAVPTSAAGPGDDGSDKGGNKTGHWESRWTVPPRPGSVSSQASSRRLGRDGDTRGGGQNAGSDAGGSRRARSGECPATTRLRTRTRSGAPSSVARWDDGAPGRDAAINGGDASANTPALASTRRARALSDNFPNNDALLGHNGRHEFVVKPYWSSWKHAVGSRGGSFSASYSKRLQSPFGRESDAMLTRVRLAGTAEAAHQAQVGRLALGTPREHRPRYMDTPEKPYAVFVFKYRSKETIERLLKVTIEEEETEEKRRLRSLSKDRIIAELLKAKSSRADRRAESAPDENDAVRSMPTGWNRADSDNGLGGIGGDGPGFSGVRSDGDKGGFKGWRVPSINNDPRENVGLGQAGGIEHSIW